MKIETRTNSAAAATFYDSIEIHTFFVGSLKHAWADTIYGALFGTQTQRERHKKSHNGFQFHFKCCEIDHGLAIVCFFKQKNDNFSVF